MSNVLLHFEKQFFNYFISLVYFCYFGFTFEVIYKSVRKDPWVWIHFPMSFMYVTCIWFHLYIWWAKMSQIYFISCVYELPLIWDIFVCIILPYYFPNWFDFYEIPGVENIFIDYCPGKEIKVRS